MAIIIPRGNTTTETAKFIGNDKEITIDTDKHSIVVHDGVTKGGFIQGFSVRDDGDWDFTKLSFTADGSWHDLDLSAIVPSGTKWVYLNWKVAYGNPWTVYLRKKGYTGNRSLILFYNGVGEWCQKWVPCDSNRVIEYSTSNITFTTLNMAVIGWTI